MTLLAKGLPILRSLVYISKCLLFPCLEHLYPTWYSIVESRQPSNFCFLYDGVRNALKRRVRLNCTPTLLLCLNILKHMNIKLTIVLLLWSVYTWRPFEVEKGWPFLTPWNSKFQMCIQSKFKVLMLLCPSVFAAKFLRDFRESPWKFGDNGSHEQNATDEPKVMGDHFLEKCDSL